MKYKVLVTDIDRTFAKQGRIFPENLEYLQYLKTNNIILVANTGRGLNTCNFIIKLNIFDYLIGNNGAFIYDLKLNKLLFNTQMLMQDTNNILKIADKYKMPCVIESLNYVYFTDVPETHSEKFVNNSNYPFLYTDYVKENVNRMLIMLGNDKAKKFINEILNFLRFNKNKFNYFYNIRTLEITNKNASKGKGLLRLLTQLDISIDNTLVIGDSVNDVSMLKLAKMSIAMKDSDQVALDNANYVTDSENNKGWLKGIQHYE